MRTFFRITGACILLVAFVGALGTLSTDLALAVFAGLASIALGLAFFALAGLMDRVAYLEGKLNLQMPEQDEELPQTTCPECGREYDFDYPKCPYCGGTEAGGSVED